MNDYHKSKIFSDGDNSKVEDNLNFVKQGRKSIKRGGKSSEKDKRTILPVKIRGNYDRRSDEKSPNKTKYHKDSGSLPENKYQNHPMIINQMNDPKEFAVLTPKSGIRDIKHLKTTTSYYPSNVTQNSNTEEINLPLFQIEKSNNYLKKKIAYEFNLKEIKANTEKPSPLYKMKYDMSNHKAYNDDPSDLPIPKMNFQNDFHNSDSGVFTNPGKYPSNRVMTDKEISQEKKFPYHVYKKDKLVAKAIKIKTIDRKYHKDFLDKRALD